MAKRLGAKNRSLKDLGVKQAPFVVLIGAGMPSVLAEISFVTNKQDGDAAEDARPTASRSRRRSCDAVVDYQQSLKRMNAIAAKKATERSSAAAATDGRSLRSAVDGRQSAVYGSQLGVTVHGSQRNWRYNRAVTSLQPQPATPSRIRSSAWIEQPVHETSLSDVILGSLGLVGVLLIAARCSGCCWAAC